MSSKLLGYEDEIKNKNILSMQVNLLNKCTSKCKSCRKYTWPDDILSVSDVKNLFRWFAEQSGQTIVFSGGDPILYKDFEEIALFAESLGIQWSIFSTLITTDENKIKFLGEHASRLHISVDAVNKELYKEIRGVNAWEIVDKNIKLLQSYRTEKIPIRISSTITSLNYNHCLKIYDYAKLNGILLKFYPAQKWVNNKKEYQENNIGMNNIETELFYSQMEIVAKDEKKNNKTISNSLDMLTEKFKYDNNLPTRSHCYISSVNASVNANGDLYPCCKCLDDNGFYGEQLKYVYGNIKGKNCAEIENEFKKRHNPNCEITKDCYLRYGESLIEELEAIVENIKHPIFL